MNSFSSLKNKHRACFAYFFRFLFLLTFISITVTKASQDLRGNMNEIVSEVEFMAKDGYRPPIIGVLTEVLRDYKRFTAERHLHIAASYVKWLEASGAQVMPVLLNQDDSYYERIFQQTNGLLFPGGDNLLDPYKSTPMMVAAKKLYKLAVDANQHGDHYPIWGTCLGFELLSVLTLDENVLDNCSANDLSLPMSFKSRGRMFAPSNMLELATDVDYSLSVMKVLSTKGLTYNHHHKCLTDASFERAPELKSFYRPLAYSRDKLGKEFIAIFEAIHYPFYGVQFHPEKPAFEFVIKKGQINMAHSKEAVAISRYFGDFFIRSAQKNLHRPAKTEELSLELIYAFTPMYTALKRDIYEQRYLFPYQDSETISTEEFLDYCPDEDEEVPEEVTQRAEDKSFEQSPKELRESDIIDPELYLNSIELLIVRTKNNRKREILEARNMKTI